MSEVSGEQNLAYALLQVNLEVERGPFSDCYPLYRALYGLHCPRGSKYINEDLAMETQDPH